MSGNNNDFDFDADDSYRTIEIPVKYQGRKYILREASGDAIATYLDSMLSATEQEVSEDGHTKIRRTTAIKKFDLLLLSLCLCETGQDGEILFSKMSTGNGSEAYSKPITVNQAVLSEWPDRILKPLIDKAKSISGLTQSSEDSEEKRDEAQELGKGLQQDSMNGSA